MKTWPILGIHDHKTFTAYTLMYLYLPAVVLIELPPHLCGEKITWEPNVDEYETFTMTCDLSRFKSLTKDIQINGLYIFKKDGTKNGSVLAAFRPCHVKHKCMFNLHFPAGRVWEAARVPPEHQQIHCNKDLDVSIFKLTLTLKDTMQSDAGDYGCRFDYCTRDINVTCDINDCVLKIKVIKGQPITTLAEFPPERGEVPTLAHETTTSGNRDNGVTSLHPCLPYTFAVYVTSALIYSNH